MARVGTWGAWGSAFASPVGDKEIKQHILNILPMNLWPHQAASEIVGTLYSAAGGSPVGKGCAPGDAALELQAETSRMKTLCAQAGTH